MNRPRQQVLTQENTKKTRVDRFLRKEKRGNCFLRDSVVCGARSYSTLWQLSLLELLDRNWIDVDYKFDQFWIWYHSIDTYILLGKRAHLSNNKFILNFITLNHQRQALSLKLYHSPSIIQSLSLSLLARMEVSNPLPLSQSRYLFAAAILACSKRV